MPRLKRWYVWSPEYAYQEIVDPELGGPWYDVCDCVEVAALTKRDAVIFGVRLMLETCKDGWCNQQRSDRLSPFEGVKAERKWKS